MLRRSGRSLYPALGRPTTLQLLPALAQLRPAVCSSSVATAPSSSVTLRSEAYLKTASQGPVGVSRSLSTATRGTGTGTSNRLANQVARITGGTSGIGRGIAQRFIAEGAQVAVIGRNLEKLQRLSEELGPNLLTLQGDVMNQTDLENFFASVQSKFGAPTTLVCSAGIGYRLTLDQATLEEFDHMFNVDVRSIFSMVKLAAKHLQPEKSSVLLISSIAGHITFTNHVIYSAAKAAVTKMTSNFAMDLAAQGIRVNAISPGFIQTPIFDSKVQDDPQFFEKLSSTIPLQRMGQPEDSAQAASFLCSNEASYITGVDLLVYGGFSHQRMLPTG